MKIGNGIVQVVYQVCYKVSTTNERKVWTKLSGIRYFVCLFNLFDLGVIIYKKRVYNNFP